MSKTFNTHERYIAFMALGFGHDQSSVRVFNRPIESERDTYRELCGELMHQLCSALPYAEDCVNSAEFKRGFVEKRVKEIKQAITKAEKLLGEENGNSN